MLKPLKNDMVKNDEIYYSFVVGIAKRARQIIAGDEPLVEDNGKKPLSIAVEELNEGKIKIINDEEE